ncbi:foldase protein PrsA [Marinisporobacter balticus]|uniref:Foldase protein PrsA n=2 Tax=Marinisporobacter balticus TaxID=2018667 RepID=A0A4R2KMS4_9FIRM|nr:foldase protein PrsA [Marinisporobacter balticus]
MMKFIKSKIFIVVVLVFVMIFAVGCTNKATSMNEKDVVAKVGEQVIGLEAYNKKLILIKKNIEEQYGEKIWSMDMNGKTYLQAVQEKVLDQMIDEEAIVKYMQDKKIVVSDKEIEKQYENYKESMKDQTEAKKFLEENGIDESFVKNQIKTDMYVNKFQQKMIEDLKLTDKKLEADYKKNEAVYTKDQTKASHILVEDEKTAKDLLKRIKSGEDFGKLAKEFSKDPGSAMNGGDLGIFGKGMMVPEFEAVAFSLKPGEVSDPVKTQFGYHIIKGDTIKFEDVKEKIRMDMIQKKIVDQLDAIKKDLKIEKFPEKIK